MVALHIKMIYNTEVIKEIHLSKRDETMDSGDSRYIFKIMKLTLSVSFVLLSQLFIRAFSSKFHVNSVQVLAVENILSL